MPVAAMAAMALPDVKTLTDCTDFSKTVAPFIDQLYSLPQRVSSSITDLESLKAVYLSTNPLITAFALSLLFGFIFLIVSEANKNYSQVDRCWSLLPTFYIAHYTLWAHLNDLPHRKLDSLLMFAGLWSARLTYNYARRGGYSVGSEDYRWMIVKEYVNNGAIWFAFNVVFICFIQSILLFSVTFPAYILLLASRITGEGLSTSDLIFSRALMALVAVEYIADGQQWDYQTAKHDYLKTAKVPEGYEQADLDLGFNTHGLWKWSRHPNFLAEQTIWVLLYQWACFETFSFFNWAFAAPLSYLFLFQGSTWLTELISAGKYPEYKIYQSRVGKFVPKLLGPRWEGAVVAQAKASAQEGKKDGKKAK